MLVEKTAKTGYEVRVDILKLSADIAYKQLCHSNTVLTIDNILDIASKLSEFVNKK